MAADFSPGSPPCIGRPRALFEIPPNTLSGGTPARCYEVAPDGRHFYAIRRSVTPTPPIVTQINLITNWVEELKAKVEMN